MTSRNLVPAVLLLSLTAPVATRAAQGPALNASASSVAATSEKVALRRARSAGKEELSADLIEQAGEFLRCSAQGGEPSCELRESWEQFYGSCDAVIRKFARKLAPHGIDTDDCAQDVWADLVGSLPDFRLDRSRGKFTSWLYTIVRSKATDQLRRIAREGCEGIDSAAAAATPLTDNPAAIAERESSRRSVQDAIAELKAITSERSFQVLYLRHLQGLSVSEVAQSLGMKPGQVWVTEHRMKRKLRSLLPEHDG
jgi:RNA polymerase sigma-70 factor (ECF subfamily)